MQDVGNATKLSTVLCKFVVTTKRSVVHMIHHLIPLDAVVELKVSETKAVTGLVSFQNVHLCTLSTPKGCILVS